MFVGSSDASVLFLDATYQGVTTNFNIIHHLRRETACFPR